MLKIILQDYYPIRVPAIVPLEVELLSDLLTLCKQVNAQMQRRTRYFSNTEHQRRKFIYFRFKHVRFIHSKGNFNQDYLFTLSNWVRRK